MLLLNGVLVRLWLVNRQFVAIAFHISEQKSILNNHYASGRLIDQNMRKIEPRFQCPINKKIRKVRQFACVLLTSQWTLLILLLSVIQNSYDKSFTLSNASIDTKYKQSSKCFNNRWVLVKNDMKSFPGIKTLLCGHNKHQTNVNGSP